MAKKIWFGKTFSLHYKVLHEIEKAAKEQGIENKDEIINYFFNYCKDFSQTKDDVLNLQLFRLELDGIIPHYFIETKELKSFLLDTKVKDYEGIKKYVQDNGFKIINPENDNKLSDTFAVNVHTPFEKEGYTLFYSIVDHLLVVFVSHGEVLTHCDSSIFTDKAKFEKEDPDVIKQTNFAINFLYYTICFPDSVIDGVPKMENEEKFDSGKIVKTAEKILESTEPGKTVIPHFRKGYFKRLESDYFVNKKGQIIFVHETMVKGKAKTVTEKQ